MRLLEVVVSKTSESVSVCVCEIGAYFFGKPMIMPPEYIGFKCAGFLYSDLGDEDRLSDPFEKKPERDFDYQIAPTQRARI